MRIPRCKYDAPEPGRIGRFISVGLLISAACFFAGCRNPFFPSIGTPDKVLPSRSTPEGVIKQLIQAYEMKDIYRFEDLFPKSGSFQFYICPSFETCYKDSGRFYKNPPELRDPRLEYINESSYYYYWKQSVEILSHRGLFSKAETIRFTAKPCLRKCRYLVDNGDTTNAELQLEGGRIEIKVKTSTFSDEFPVELEKQVFFLERDESDLWVMRKWYDFGQKQRR